ncbi:MAG: hypothetical protein ACE5IZ_08905 [Dehalococcoidia bacterium]
MPKKINVLRGIASTYEVDLARRWLGYLRDKRSEGDLKDFIAANAMLTQRAPLHDTNLDIQPYCDRYCEAPPFNLYDTVERDFFDLQQGVKTPGWSPAGYPARPRGVSKELMGKLGEGLAGWHLETNGFSLLYRTIGDVSPDFYVQRQSEIAIVEVKTTARPLPARGLQVLSAQVKEASIDVLRAWSSLLYLIGPNPYSGYAMGVRLERVENITPTGSDLEIHLVVLKLNVR